MHRVLWITAAVLAAAFSFMFAAEEMISKEIQRVLVTNFPSLQRVEGTVTVGSPVPLAAMASLSDVLVSPVGPSDTNHLVAGGVIEATGFGQMVLSLVGQTRGDITRPGAVGAILVPDEEPILRALEEKGAIQFALETAAPLVTSATPYFASSQPRVLLAFPRYRVFFYNATDKTVTVTLYAYMTS